MPEWDQVSLGEVLTRSRDTITLDPNEIYKQVTVRMKHKGVTLREQKKGAEIGSPRQYVARPGQFIISSIDARNGAMGLVPGELDGAIVTNDFWLFDVNNERLDQEWLRLYSSTAAFVEACTSASEGTTNRVRLKPDRFLQLDIPLPPLPEQQRIVTRIKSMLEKAEEVRNLSRESKDAFSLLTDPPRLGRFFIGTGEPLGNYVEIYDPNPSHRYPNYLDSGIPIISTVNFSGINDINTENTKKVDREFYLSTIGYLNPNEEDVIFARKGKIGYARPYPRSTQVAMTHTLCLVRPNSKFIRPGYLRHLLMSSEFIDYLKSTMNNNVGVPTLGLGVIRNTPVVLPALKEQDDETARIESIGLKLESIKNIHAVSSEEINALSSSILARAFSGEL